MGAFIARQPNGLLCRFSEIVDCPTDINMTEQAYIELCKQKAMAHAEEEAKEILKGYVRPFKRVIEAFAPNNMTVEEFTKMLREMGYDGEVPEYESSYEIIEDGKE